MVSHLYNISFIFLTSLFMVDFIVYIRVIRVIRSMDHPLCSFVIMSFCLKKIICLHLSLCHSVFKKIICLHLSLCHCVFKKSFVSICHYVILSSKIPLSSSVPLLFCLQKNHLSPFFIMSFCLQENHLSPFFIMSFCLKKTFVSICHYVILFQKNHLSPSVPLLFCLKKSPCLYLSLCYSVSHLFCLYRVEKS